MRVRKVLRILSFASGRTLSCWYYRSQGVHRLFLRRHDVRQRVVRVVAHEAKSALSVFEQICSMTVHLQEGTPADQFLSVLPEAFLNLQLQQIPTKRATNN